MNRNELVQRRSIVLFICLSGCVNPVAADTHAASVERSHSQDSEPQRNDSEHKSESSGDFEKDRQAYLETAKARQEAFQNTIEKINAKAQLSQRRDSVFLKFIEPAARRFDGRYVNILAEDMLLAWSPQTRQVFLFDPKTGGNRLNVQFDWRIRHVGRNEYIIEAAGLFLACAKTDSAFLSVQNFVQDPRASGTRWAITRTNGDFYLQCGEYYLNAISWNRGVYASEASYLQDRKLGGTRWSISPVERVVNQPKRIESASETVSALQLKTASPRTDRSRSENPSDSVESFEIRRQKRFQF